MRGTGTPVPAPATTAGSGVGATSDGASWTLARASNPVVDCDLGSPNLLPLVLLLVDGRGGLIASMDIGLCLLLRGLPGRLDGGLRDGLPGSSVGLFNGLLIGLSTLILPELVPSSAIILLGVPGVGPVTLLAMLALLALELAALNDRSACAMNAPTAVRGIWGKGSGSSGGRTVDLYSILSHHDGTRCFDELSYTPRDLSSSPASLSSPPAPLVSPDRVEFARRRRIGGPLNSNEGGR